MGSLLRTILRQKTLKKGTKKECSEFIDRPKKSYEKAEISNKSERRRKKPQKFDDYDFEDLTEQPTAKNHGLNFANFHWKMFTQKIFKWLSPIQSHLTKKLKKKPFLPIGKRRRFPRRRPRSKSPTVFPAKTEKSQDLRKHKAKKDKENEDKGLSNAAQKKARSEIAENQSVNIGKTVSLGMKPTWKWNAQTRWIQSFCGAGNHIQDLKKPNSKDDTNSIWQSTPGY